MDTTHSQSRFNTLEGYENFVNGLLRSERELIVDPLLEWEDGISSDNFLLISVDN